MSALDDEIAKELVPNKVCGVCKWYDKLPEDIQASFQQLLTNRIDLSKIHRACTRIDPPLPLAYQALTRHVRECLR